MNDTAITTTEERVSQKNLDISGRSNVPAHTMKNSISVNNDMIYFKNELLKEMKKIKLELSNKFTEYTSELDEKIKKTSNANMELDEKIDYVAKNFENKLNNLFGQKTIEHFEKSLLETKDNIVTNNIKLQALREELRIHKGQYEDIVRHNILYQGMIGPGCKYRNFHEYIDFVNSSINNLITVNNQKAADMKNYKNKIDNIIHNINSQINEITIGYKSFVHQSIKDFGEKVDKDFSSFENKLFEQKTLIVQGNKDIENQLLEFSDKYKTLAQIEINVNESKGKLLENINESNSKINETLESHQKELEEIKNQQNDLMKSFQEIKEKLNNSNNIFNRKKNLDLMNIKKFKKIDVKTSDNFHKNNNNNDDETNNGAEFNIGNKKFKHQSTETLNMNQNNNEQTPPKNNVTKIYLKMNKGKNARKGSGKILKSERLEKFKFLYGNESINNENLFLNKSNDSIQTLNNENGTNKNEQKNNSSIQEPSSRRIKNKNIIEKYTSNDLYNTGLFVNFNSKCEEDNYINNLKNNALCLKLLENGVKLDKIYSDVLNRNASNPSDYFFNSKIKEKIHNARQFNKEKNYFNKSFNNKKGSINYNLEKYSEYGQKGENDTAFVIKNYENDMIRKKSQTKLKIKSLIAIE